MSTGMSEEEIYRLAKKRVERKKGFYVHLAIYLCVNTLLVIIWTISESDFPWFVFPLAGWSIAIILHYLSVFVRSGGGDKAAIENEAEKIRREQK
jgi:hypothetical protein